LNTSFRGYGSEEAEIVGRAVFVSYCHAQGDWVWDCLIRFLQRNQSVNLIVRGNPKWWELITYISTERIEDLGRVDLSIGAMVSCRGLVAEILNACGTPGCLPPEPEDLVAEENGD
jgi:hypothetical protein